MVTKELQDRFKANTPIKWKRVGSAILTAGTTITASAIATDHDTVAYIALGLTVLGKMITEYFKEE